MFDILVILVIVLVIWLIVKAGSPAVQAPRRTGTMRCPTCGAQAKIRGDVWECGWCADCGRISYK